MPSEYWKARSWEGERNSTAETGPQERVKRPLGLSRIGKALGWAVAFCTALFALALVTAHLPTDEGLRESLAEGILWPILLIPSALSRLVDLVAPTGRAELASMYLQHWAGLLLFVRGVALFVALLAGAILCARALADRRGGRFRRGRP